MGEILTDFQDLPRPNPILDRNSYDLLTGFRNFTSHFVTRASQADTRLDGNKSYLRLTLEGFPFVTVNTKEYHSECSAMISEIMRRTL
ncbi:hypothetical protein Tco_1064331 [Tanacetum coccineum]